MTAPAVQIEDLVVHRGGKLILDRVSCAVEPGTVTGLLGPSGSGKTTLMRCVVGMQKTVSGRVSVLGRPAGTPALRREVAYVTQSPSTYGDLSVLENVRHFAALYGKRAAHADAAIERVDLAKYTGQLVRTLSGGQRSRVGLACALVAEPRMLVLDEPTVGQDPVLRRGLWEHFRELARTSGVTILVSSHVMDEAARCDRVLLVREGTIIADSTPDELRTVAGTDDLDEAFLRLVERPAAPDLVRTGS
ncbi:MULTISPECIES: ABC transporter ATP-binding protein [unclassified Streptomyces]|uniref:ABC transporter ATP-binding protein n=1 Tax=unclassified Streptomyces TaxID=2593676 RepID=UPI001661C7B2|nr:MULTISPECIES: ABC transporter ATP-binding protein [unclassified Streptomyces]MBD0838239.1 ABC transporter ATP-binding protein [Streptomyces sp. TRM68416]